MALRPRLAAGLPFPGTREDYHGTRPDAYARWSFLENSTATFSTATSRAPSSSRRALGLLGIFLSGQPSLARREMLRLVVAVDTLTPSSSSNASQCSSGVRSGLL